MLFRSNSSANSSVALVAGDYANGSNWGKIALQGNASSNATAQIEANVVNFQPASGGANIVKITTLSTSATSTTTGAVRVAGGAGITGNLYVGGLISGAGTITGGNLATAGTLSAGGNANVGNLETGIVSASGNITGTNQIGRAHV